MGGQGAQPRPQPLRFLWGDRAKGRQRSPLDAQPTPKPSGAGGGLQFNRHPCPPARVADGGFDFDFDARQVRTNPAKRGTKGGTITEPRQNAYGD